MPLNFGNGQTVDVVAPDVPVIRVLPPAISSPIVVPIAGPQGIPGPPGPPGNTSSQIRLTGIAESSLSGHRAVTQNSDGTIRYADNATIEHLHAPIWLTTGATAPGDLADLLAYGPIHEVSWSWNTGPIYLGANGLITQIIPTAPGALFLAQIGVATGATSAWIDRRSSIVLI